MSSVRIEHAGPVTTITMSRPAVRNAVDGPTADELSAAFKAFDADPDAAVAILHGDGAHFCPGADMKSIGTDRSNKVTSDGDGPMGPTRLRLSKPVIAAIEGHAVAGGMELALWCDLRVVAEDATFGVFCRRWGVPLIDGGSVRLPRLIGESVAMDLILTGRAVDAAEALRIGLANRVVPTGKALSAAHELASGLAKFPQTTMRNDRLSMMEEHGLTETEALANEYRRGVGSLAADTAAGAELFQGGAGRHGSFEDFNGAAA